MLRHTSVIENFHLLGMVSRSKKKQLRHMLIVNSEHFNISDALFYYCNTGKKIPKLCFYSVRMLFQLGG